MHLIKIIFQVYDLCVLGMFSVYNNIKRNIIILCLFSKKYKLKDLKLQQGVWYYHRVVVTYTERKDATSPWLKYNS